MKTINEVLPSELNQDHIFILGDRHGYDGFGIDTFHKDIVQIIAKGHYGLELSEDEVKDILGTFDQPNNISQGIEYVVGRKGMDIIMPDKRLIAISTGDLVCSRRPGEMKVRNIIGKAAKQSRLRGINQHVTLMDLIDAARKKDETGELQELAEKVSDLTHRRFASLSGVEKYMDFNHLVGNADVLPSILISEVAPHVATLLDIYKKSGVFSTVFEHLGVYHINDQNAAIFVPYSVDFNQETRIFRENVEVDTKQNHILVTHETLDTEKVGDGRNVEGRELYNYVISKTKPKVGFSGDTHQPTQEYSVVVGDIRVRMTQISTTDVVCYNMKED